MSMLVRYTLQMVGSLVLMFYLNAALTGVLLAVVPIVSIVAVQYGKLCSRSTIITLCHGVSLHILLKCLKNTFDQFIAIIFLKYFLLPKCKAKTKTCRNQES